MATARTYKDLDVWQVADALRREIYRLTRTGPAASDFRYKAQLCDAARGVPSHLAEGFRRRSPADFARFVIYAYSAVAEVTDRLEDGLANRYWTAEDIHLALSLTRRLNRGLTRLHAYLLSRQAAENAAKIRERPGPIRSGTEDPVRAEVIGDPIEKPKRDD